MTGAGAGDCPRTASGSFCLLRVRRRRSSPIHSAAGREYRRGGGDRRQRLRGRVWLVVVLQRAASTPEIVGRSPCGHINGGLAGWSVQRRCNFQARAPKSAASHGAPADGWGGDLGQRTGQDCDGSDQAGVGQLVQSPRHRSGQRESPTTMPGKLCQREQADLAHEVRRICWSRSTRIMVTALRTPTVLGPHFTWSTGEW